MAKLIEVSAGDSYGMLTVVAPAADYIYSNKARRRQFTVVCSCGSSPFIANINNLRTGTTKSCGCTRKKHGMYKARQYQCWADMKTRCDNTEHANYADYGGRGITYPAKWATFEGFWEDMADGYADNLTINRVNNEAGYSKDNCAWDVQGDQNHMRRKRKRTTSSVVGFVEDSRYGFKYARITHRGRRYSLGKYETEAEIAEAYDTASEYFYGDRPNGTELRDSSIRKSVLQLIKDKQ